MKMFAKTLLASSLLLSAAGASAEDVGSGFDVSANVMLASEYLWRGISQTQGKGAIQGGVDVVHESGAYIGTWASNVDFDSEASSEWDFYAGYRFTVADTVGFDVGLLEYTYTEQSSLNFLEAYAKVSAFGFTLGYNYQLEGESNANIAGGASSSETFTYTSLAYSTSLPADIGLALSVAQYDLKDGVFVNSSGSTVDKYNHWGVTVSKPMLGLNWAVSYNDSDLTDSECASFVGNANYCNDVMVLTVAKAL